MEPQTGQDAGAGEGHHAADPGPCTIRALRRSVMKRTRIKGPRARSERPWLEALSRDPRDPDIVRAKALARTARSLANRSSRLRCPR
jgi:hypothetical protein